MDGRREQWAHDYKFITIEMKIELYQIESAEDAIVRHGGGEEGRWACEVRGWCGMGYKATHRHK